MQKFMDRDFLLSTETARELFHGTAKNMPILDYHCHLSPREIAEDKKFQSITEVWLGGDHYKWRLLRAAGCTEDLVTGNAPDREKFRAFASVMPQLMGSPVYHWSHLELQRAFGIYEPLTPDTADSIYTRANKALQKTSARGLMRQFNVRAVCTTDDPADELCWHEQIAKDPDMEIKVLPAFRPDNAVNLEKPGFGEYIRKLSARVGRVLQTAQDVAAALTECIEDFAEAGALCADHGLDSMMYAPPEPAAANAAFGAAMAGAPIDPAQADAYRTLLLLECAKKYVEIGWVMQIHFGALRDVNRPMLRRLGRDVGGDAINNRSGSEKLGMLLNAIEENSGLPKLILYSLNPNDNAAIASIMGTFQGGGVPGKLQLGSAWWFNDSRPGMRAQLTELACNGVLGQFVGMLTDSRSFLSYPRHEYFRRVLCELIGEWVESGQYPDDRPRLEKIVADLSYNNTKNYFGF
ncbi:glucuronate isomerase [Acutalibacter muris]|uniref:glucuronate isomerase n=1 Tax=Acutalibacter muris TaxID=1796620 RepID=UPI00272DE6AF|nr:glucuronate isomerase [Acutalibacter muris]